MKFFLMLFWGTWLLSSPVFAQSSSEYVGLAGRELRASLDALKARDQALACRHLSLAETYTEMSYPQFLIEFEPVMRSSAARLEAARSYDSAQSVHSGGYIPVRGYIEAQIMAASAGVRGRLSTADAVRDYYATRQKLLNFEQAVQRSQMSIRHSKETLGCP